MRHTTSHEWFEDFRYGSLRTIRPSWTLYLIESQKESPKHNEKSPCTYRSFFFTTYTDERIIVFALHETSRTGTSDLYYSRSFFLSDDIPDAPTKRIHLNPAIHQLHDLQTHLNTTTVRIKKPRFSSKTN